MKAQTSGGDLSETLKLLWRHTSVEARGKRGPRRSLDVDRIVDAGIQLVDAEGLDALSMRRLADGLGVSAMTIYTYVPGRAELIDLMLDHLYATMPRHPWSDEPWIERVRAVAHNNRQLFMQHRWASEVSTLRPVLGPGQLGKYEHELGAFDGSGLEDTAVDDALTLVLTFVRANARDMATALQRSDTDGQWWAAAGPLLDELIDAEEYPLAMRVGQAAGQSHDSAHDPDHAYEFGLNRLLDALWAMSAQT